MAHEKLLPHASAREQPEAGCILLRSFTHLAPCLQYKSIKSVLAKDEVERHRLRNATSNDEIKALGRKDFDI